MTAIAWDGRYVVVDSARSADNTGRHRVVVRKIRVFTKPIALSRTSKVRFTACVGSGSSRIIDSTYFLLDDVCTEEFGVKEWCEERKKYLGLSAHADDLCGDFYLIGMDGDKPVMYRLNMLRSLDRHMSGSGASLLKHSIFEFMKKLDAVDMAHAMTLVESGTCGYPLIKYNPATGKLTEISKASDAKKRQLKRLYTAATTAVANKAFGE